MVDKKTRKSLIKQFGKIDEAKEAAIKVVGSKNTARIAILIGILACFYILGKGVMAANDFFDKYRIVRQPWILLELRVQSPVYLEDRNIKHVDASDKVFSPIVEKPSPVPTKRPETGPSSRLLPWNGQVDLGKLELIKKSRYPEFIGHIWIKETTQGTTKDPLSQKLYCESIGMTNEFGFYPAGQWCFSTFEEGIARLEKWHDEDSAGLSFNQKLCYYNGAGKVNNCNYLDLEKGLAAL